MKAREIVSWCLAGVLALVAVTGWGFYADECRARADEREQWRANIRLLESHAHRGMMLEVQNAREHALRPGQGTSN
jgi:hypothetical protein